MLAAMARTLMIDGAAGKLEARLTGEGPLALVAPPHPVYGGTLGNPVVRALEYALRAAALATLAFNFRGTGESDGEPSADLELARDDYLSVASTSTDLALFSGYSFGGVAALKGALARHVPRVLMVAPPLGLLETSLLTEYPGQLLVAIGDQDEYTPVTAIEDFFIARPNTRVELLPGLDHWYLGSALQELSAALHRLLA
jgi:alpha/beta superfamily hydrolase